MPDTKGWEVADADPWWNDTLRLVRPGAAHSVLLFWSEAESTFQGWYVNLEEPMQRTAIGFDYMDQTLDIVVSPDLSEWRWKDEDELQQALDAGIVSEETALRIRAEGERVIESMDRRDPPFNGDWERWRPDPGWAVAVLPAGWDSI